MKCFVTGATGHLGNVLVKKLYDQGHQITSLVLPNDKNINIIEPYTDIVYGDIMDYEKLLKIVLNFDVVFHLAGIVEISSGKWNKLYNVNVLGSNNILKVCQKNKIKRLVYTSSVHAFEEAEKGIIMVEPREFNYKKVKGNYAKTKALASDILMNQNVDDLEVIIVCPSGIIGPYDYQLSNTGQIFIDCMLGRLTAYINGGYNFVDVRDVADGIINASIKGKNKEVYLLTGDNISVKELLDYICEQLGKKPIKTRLARWFILITSYFAELYYKLRKQKPLFTYYSVKVLGSNHAFSSEKARINLGFTNRNIKETLKDTLTFIEGHYMIKDGKKWKKKFDFN